MYAARGGFLSAAHRRAFRTRRGDLSVRATVSPPCRLKCLSACTHSLCQRSPATTNVVYREPRKQPACATLRQAWFRALKYLGGV